VDRISAQADEKASCGTAINHASLAWRAADINFLAGIIKRGCPTAPYLSDMRRELLVASMGEKTMESLAYGIGNLVGFQLILGFMFGIDLAPSIVAVVRGHHRWPWIGLLNFAAGWTVAGWIAALVWSVTGIRQPAITHIGSTGLMTAPAGGGVKPRTRRVSAPLPLSRGLPSSL
jgi:hypothetical protein